MVRIIIFVNGYGNAVGSVCNLSYGVDNKSVILFAVV